MRTVTRIRVAFMFIALSQDSEGTQSAAVTVMVAGSPGRHGPTAASGGRKAPAPAARGLGQAGAAGTGPGIPGKR